MGKTILCVEDERKTLDSNRKALENDGYTVLTAENLAQAWAILSRQAPEAIVLDIMLPDGLGLDLLKELRETGSRIPVLLLTALGAPSDVARGLRAGANDYLPKPFEYEVLLARVETMLRNAEQMPARVTRGALSLDVLSLQAFLNGKRLSLTQKEFALLMLLIQNEDRALSAEYTYETVWQQPYVPTDRALASNLYRLRKKLEGSEYAIVNVRGVGYRFEKA